MWAGLRYSWRLSIVTAACRLPIASGSACNSSAWSTTSRADPPLNASLSSSGRCNGKPISASDTLSRVQLAKALRPSTLQHQAKPARGRQTLLTRLCRFSKSARKKRGSELAVTRTLQARLSRQTAGDPQPRSLYRHNQTLSLALRTIVYKRIGGGDCASLSDQEKLPAPRQVGISSVVCTSTPRRYDGSPRVAPVSDWRASVEREARGLFPCEALRHY